MFGRRRVWGLVAAMVPLGAAMVGGLPQATAQAADLGAVSVVAQTAIQPDGTVKVTETVTLTQAAASDITQTLALTERTGRDSDFEYRFTVDDIRSSDTELSTKTSGDETRITVKAQGKTSYTVSYVVRGTTFANADDSVTMSWRPIQGFPFPVQEARVLASTPGAFSELECRAGNQAALRVCKATMGGHDDSDQPAFVDGPLAPGEVVDIAIRFPAHTLPATAVISEDWSLDRAFTATGWPLGAAALGVLLSAVALWWLSARAGRDAAFKTPTRIADFAPVGLGSTEFTLLEPLRPGQAGTLSDEIVNPIDITASVVDLAVRGHLLITELPRDGVHAPMDWTLIRRSGADALEQYEADLLDAIAPTVGEARKVSELSTSIGTKIAAIQDHLYEAMVERGWYSRRPDGTRGRVRAIGIAAITAAVLGLVALVAFTRFGLLGLVLIAFSVGLLLIAKTIPARTAAGASMLAGLHMLANELQTEPTNRMPPGREYAELSEVLPYAIVLGGRDRWIQAIADADDDVEPDPEDLSWYHAPATWNLADFPVSIDAFITTVTGKLFDRG